MAEPERKTLLGEGQLAQARGEIPHWDFSDDRFARAFEFANFIEAFGFMSQVALIAERLDHHPEWSNVWNKVRIEITNHDAGGVTELDVEFCRRVDGLVGRGETRWMTPDE